MGDFICVLDSLLNKYVKTNPNGNLTKQLKWMYRLFASSVNANDIIISNTAKDLCNELKNRDILAYESNNDCYLKYKHCPITRKLCCIKKKRCLLKPQKKMLLQKQYHIKRGTIQISGLGDLTNYISFINISNNHKQIHKKALLRFFRLHGAIIINNELIYTAKALKKFI